MSRQPQPERFQQIRDAARAEFIAKGYRQTQIADVAHRLAIAPGTIYLYFESKEALFDAVARDAAAPGLPAPPELPVRTPRHEDTLEFLRATLERRTAFPALERAVNTPAPSAAEDLDRIVREIFAMALANAAGVKLVERCAADWPELAVMWFGTFRAALQARLTDYLDRSFAAGRLRAGTSPALAARLILELIAAFAIHCPFDPLQPPIDAAQAEDAVADAVVAAYAPGGERPPQFPDSPASPERT